MSKIVLDDGYHNDLVKGAALVGAPGIPMLGDMHNVEIPTDIIPFEKCRKEKDRRKYIHFYMHDRYFSPVINNIERYLNLIKTYDGVITPDPTMLVGQAPCLLQTSVYFNRAIGVYLQRQGVPVIPNIRWSDENSFDYCFLGVPTGGIVAVSTHGCIRSQAQKKLFHTGLEALVSTLHPSDILVHGYMPPEVFDDFSNATVFHRYPSLFERTHAKEED